MARLPSFQRKAPALMIAIGDKKGPPSGGDEFGGDDEGTETAPDNEEQDPSEVAVCPACGCTFNDETGKVLKESHPQHPANGAGSGGTPAGSATDDTEAGAEY